jgi:DNA polymerase III epsilon subunit-like protein
MLKVLCFDTETTGLPKKANKWEKGPAIFQSEAWPHIVEIAWILKDTDKDSVVESCYIIKPENWDIPKEASAIHTITTDFAEKNGVRLNSIINEFMECVKAADVLVGHNIEFDIKVISAELYRLGRQDDVQLLKFKNNICTKNTSTAYCRIPGSWGKYKWPSLSELYRHLFGTEIVGSHRALVDVESTLRCFYELEKRGVIRLVG